MKLSSSFLQTEGMWEISFVPLEWCSENKNEYIQQAVLQLFPTAPFWLRFKYRNPRDDICSCECNICKNERGVFYILLYVFHYLRANFVGPFSAVVTGTGNFVCLLVYWYSYTNVNHLYLFFQVTESPTKCPAWLGDAVLGLSLVQGEIYGVPVSQLSCTAPTSTTETHHKVILCGWRKHNTVLVSIVNSSLWPGAYWFLQGQHLINLCLERRCVFVPFSVLVQWAREEKLKIPLRQLNISP